MQVKKGFLLNKKYLSLSLLCFCSSTLLFSLLNSQLFLTTLTFPSHLRKIPSSPKAHLVYKIKNFDQALYARPSDELIYYYTSAEDLIKGDFFYLSGPSELSSAESNDAIKTKPHSLVRLKESIEVLEQIKKIESPKVPLLPLSTKTSLIAPSNKSDDEMPITNESELLETALNPDDSRFDHKISKKVGHLYINNLDLVFGDYGTCKEASCKLVLECDQNKLNPYEWTFKSGEKIFLTSKLTATTELVCSLRSSEQKNVIQEIFIGQLNDKNTTRLLEENWKIEIND